jgi:hypothetical protein
MIQFGMPIFLTLLAAFWVHRSWRVVLWIIPITCALLVLLWLLLLIVFYISAGHPG